MRRPNRLPAPVISAAVPRFTYTIRRHAGRNEFLQCTCNLPVAASNLPQSRSEIDRAVLDVLLGEAEQAGALLTLAKREARNANAA